MYTGLSYSSISIAAEKGRTKIVQSRWRERKKWLWRLQRTNSFSLGGALRDSEVVAGSSGQCKCKMQKWTNFTAAHAEQRKDTQTVQLTVDHYAGAPLSREKGQWPHTLAMYRPHGNSPSWGTWPLKMMPRWMQNALTTVSQLYIQLYMAQWHGTAAYKPTKHATATLLTLFDKVGHVTLSQWLRYDTRCYFNVRSKADMSKRV